MSYTVIWQVNGEQYDTYSADTLCGALKLAKSFSTHKEKDYEITEVEVINDKDGLLVWSTNDPPELRAYLDYDQEEWQALTHGHHTNSNKPSVYFDIDGTIAKWYTDARGLTFEEMIDPANHYFRNLEPQQAMVALAEELQKRGFDVCIISAAYKDTIRDKWEWIEQHAPFIPKENICFAPIGADKTDFVKGNAEMSLLIDDYNINLEQWKGASIKALNGINHYHPDYDFIDITGSNFNLDKAVQLVEQKMNLTTPPLEISDPRHGEEYNRLLDEREFRIAEIRNEVDPKGDSEMKNNMKENMSEEELREYNQTASEENYFAYQQYMQEVRDYETNSDEEQEAPEPDFTEYLSDDELRAYRQTNSENNKPPHNSDEYHYMLLDRLKSDCDYYLNSNQRGHRNDDYLWAKNPLAQIEKMQELYDKVPQKPEWLTQADICRYAEQMGVPFYSEYLESVKKIVAQAYESDTSTMAAYENAPEAENMTFEQYVKEFGFADGTAIASYSQFCDNELTESYPEVYELAKKLEDVLSNKRGTIEQSTIPVLSKSSEDTIRSIAACLLNDDTLQILRFLKQEAYVAPTQEATQQMSELGSEIAEYTRNSLVDKLSDAIEQYMYERGEYEFLGDDRIRWIDESVRWITGEADRETLTENVRTALKENDIAPLLNYFKGEKIELETSDESFAKATELMEKLDTLETVNGLFGSREEAEKTKTEQRRAENVQDNHFDINEYDDPDYFEQQQIAEREENSEKKQKETMAERD